MALFKKHGKWYIDYYCEGHRLREKVGPSKTRAAQMLAVRQAAILQGRFELKQKRQCPTLSEFISQYLEHSKATKRSWRRDIDLTKHLNGVLGSYRLDQITMEMVEKYKMHRRQEIMARPKYQGRDPRDVPLASANRDLACLSNMFNVAIKWGKAGHNPVKGVKFFREENRTQRLLTNEQVTALLAQCSDYLKSIVTIALNTGMRLGEILNLTWEQVNMRLGYITVTKTKSGKTRQVPMHTAVYEVLKSRPRDSIFVFHENGRPYGSVKKGFKAALQRAGIGYCRFHDLRHTFATRLVLANVSLPVVKELLGHASIETTMRYSHPTPESKKSAIDTLKWQKTDLDRHQMDTRQISPEEQLVVTPWQ